MMPLKTSIRTGTDMPMNIKIAFQTGKDVYLINKKVYNYYEHPDSLSHSAVWSLPKIADLYEEVVYSIPSDKMSAFMPQLIQNRLMALKNRYLADGWRKEPVKDTPYMAQLRRDIREAQYPLTALQKRCVEHSDSVMTAALFICRNKAGIAKRILSRCFRLG